MHRQSKEKNEKRGEKINSYAHTHKEREREREREKVLKQNLENIPCFCIVQIFMCELTHKHSLPLKGFIQTFFFFLSIFYFQQWNPFDIQKNSNFIWKLNKKRKKEKKTESQSKLAFLFNRRCLKQSSFSLRYLHCSERCWCWFKSCWTTDSGRQKIWGGFIWSGCVDIKGIGPKDVFT